MTCSAMIPAPGATVAAPGLTPCPEDAEGRYLGRCPCGHIRDGWLCAGHAEQLGESGCRACIEDENAPHDCLLTVTPVAVKGDGRG